MKGEDMADLIDRQAVIDLLKKSADRDIEEVVITEKHIKLIESVPIAFDFEKVTEEIAKRDTTDGTVKVFSGIEVLGIITKGGVL